MRGGSAREDSYDSREKIHPGVICNLGGGRVEADPFVWSC